MDPSRFCNFCRLCLCSGGGLLDVFDKNYSSSTAVIGLIRDLLQIKVFRSDIHPWMICHSCLSHLQEFQRFKTRCLRNKMVLNGMFSLSADGANPTPSMNCKRREVEELQFKEGGKMQLEEVYSEDGLGTDDRIMSSRKYGPAGSVFSGQLEEAVDNEVDPIVEFCWCPECGDEFLSLQELKAHSEWCRGRRQSVWCMDENLKGEELLLANSHESINQQLFDPNVCCGGCRKMFKTKEHLIRHINKYDFKCKIKDFLSSLTVAETTIWVDGNKIPSQAVGSYETSTEQNASFIRDREEHKLKLEAHKYSQSFPEQRLCREQKLLKSLIGEQRIRKRGVANLNTKKAENEQSLNTTTWRSRDGDYVSEVQNLSLSQQLMLNSSGNKVQVDCPLCGVFLESEDILATHLINCSLGLNYESNASLDSVKINFIEMNSTIQEDNVLVGVKSSAILFGNNTTGESFTSKYVCSRASSAEMNEMSSTLGEVVSYICDYCENSHKTKPDLRNHMVKCHLALNPQKCKVCHRLFTSSEELEEHSILHPKGKKFYCTVCEKSFCYGQTLRCHIKDLHGVNVAFICSICFNGFTSKCDVGLHRTLVHSESEKPFNCSVCGKYYSVKMSYKRHVKVCQLKSVSFQGDICGKHQSSQGNLINHMHYDSEERKYPCHICPRRFWMSSSRNFHVRRVHLKLKPHECGICHKAFGSNWSLTQHFISHSDIRPFMCPGCPKSFKGKQGLKKHHLSVHKAKLELRKHLFREN